VVSGIAGDVMKPVPAKNGGVFQSALAEALTSFSFRATNFSINMNTLKVISSFSGDYHWLSNFELVSGGIPLDGLMFPTTEHAYQAAKTVHIHERQAVLHCRTPGQAKRQGKLLTLRSDWEEIKYSLMYMLCSYKFHRVPFRQLLLDTYPITLVEGNTWGDTYWGVYNGVGQNVLGRLLMHIRNELIAEAKNHGRNP